MTRRSPLVAATGVVLFTTNLFAQTLPLPVLPEPPPDPDATSADRPLPGGPAAEVVEAPTGPRPWEYAFGAGLRRDGNIDFVIPDGPSAVAFVPRAGVARSFRTSHGQWRGLAAGRWTGYTEHRELRRYYANFGLEGSYRASARTTWRATAAYELGDTASSRTLLEQGVALPRVKTRSLDGVLGLTSALGARTTLSIDGRYYRTSFDSAALIDGSSVRGTAALQRQLSDRSRTAIVYSLEDVLSGDRGRAYLTHFASLQWTQALSLRSAILLEAGGSYTPDAGRVGLKGKESFFGGASFAREVGRSSLTLFLRREVAPAFGTGISRLEVRAGVGATIPIGRTWELQAAASHVQPENPRAAGPVDAPADDAFTALAWRMGRALELSGEARYRRRGTTLALPRLEGFEAGVFLTLLSPSGGAIAPGR